MTPAPEAGAQLSPGPLAAPHSQLEGVKQCTRCHELGEGVNAAKCLDCHRLLAERIAAGRGLHAREGYADCIRCHSDHQGVDYPLIRWPDKEAGFKHETTGHVLRGAHSRLACRRCHRADLIRDPARFAAAGLDPARSYLGLGGACLDCHADPHQPSLGADCLKCHGEEAWRPASGFDHERTRYPLRGRHSGLGCAKCHPTSGAAATGDLRIAFGGIPFADCRDCHVDPHAARFTEACASCHSVEGWRQAAGGHFDHDRTRYPLRGRHAALDCTACHRAGAPHRPLAYARCLDCHADKHGGRFMAENQVRDCGECHDLAGFSPSTFTLEQHASSRYPLAGSHLAVACRDCHQPTAQEPAGRFHFESTSCIACHANPHGDSLAVRGTALSCESCHQAASWRLASYPHEGTGFPLAQRHAEIACLACHLPPAGMSAGSLRFGGLKRDCAACHEDVHQGQFLPPGESVTRCDRCHDSRDWFAARFDHQRDARFKLEGAHASLACRACHPPLESAGASKTLRYRPLPMDCKSCHPDLGVMKQGSG